MSHILICTETTPKCSLTTVICVYNLFFRYRCCWPSCSSQTIQTVVCNVTTYYKICFTLLLLQFITVPLTACNLQDYNVIDLVCD